MTDDDEIPPFYAPHQPPPPPRQPRPGELLFDFVVGGDHYRVELRDHGAYGVEAQYFVNGEHWQACRFLERAWAIKWAEKRRGEILRGEHAWL